MTRCFFVTALFFFFCSFSGREFVLVNSIPVSAPAFTTDNLGNVYTIEAAELVKYDSTGNKVATFSRRIPGGLSQTDVSNPHHLLLFYAGFPQVLFLDKTLSPKGAAVALSQFEADQAILACVSFDNSFWVYDSRSFRLVKINPATSERKNESADISRITGIGITPNFLMEKNNRVYLNDPAVGILVFDVFGSYYKTIPLKGLSSMQVEEDKLIYFYNDSLRTYNMKTLAQEAFVVPGDDPKHIRAVRLEFRRMYVLRTERIDIYTF